MLIMGFQVLSLESQVFVQNALFVNTPTFALAPQTHQSKKTLKNKGLIALRSRCRHSTTELFPQTGRDYSVKNRVVNPYSYNGEGADYGLPPHS